MRGVGIKTLPHYYGDRQHGYMPRYRTTVKGVDSVWWHSYKVEDRERVYHTWEEAFQFLLTRFHGNLSALYESFQGLLTTERLAERTRLWID